MRHGAKRQRQPVARVSTGYYDRRHPTPPALDFRLVSGPGFSHAAIRPPVFKKSSTRRQPAQRASNASPSRQTGVLAHPHSPIARFSGRKNLAPGTTWSSTSGSQVNSSYARSSGPAAHGRGNLLSTTLPLHGLPLPGTMRHCRIRVKPLLPKNDPSKRFLGPLTRQKWPENTLLTPF